MLSEPTAQIRFRLLRPGATPPHRATSGSSGYDLRACIDDPDGIAVGADPVRVPTGLAIEAPEGIDVQIRGRSGLAAQGVLVTLGTIDADYRGEIFVTMYTIGSRAPHVVRNGDRIAQIVMARLAPVEWVQAEALSETERGARGHGSTGR